MIAPIWHFCDEVTLELTRSETCSGLLQQGAGECDGDWGEERGHARCGVQLDLKDEKK